MSFAAEVKEELLRASEVRGACCAEAQLYGMMLFGREFSARGMCLRTENRALAEHACAQLHEVALAAAQLEPRGRKWEVSVPRAEERLRLLERFGHGGSELTLRIVRENFTCEDCPAAFLRGAFLSCAAVSAPERQYHLEFYISYKNLARELCELLTENELPPKLCQRNGIWLAYYKDSTQIEDVLAFLGARLAMLDLINTKIEKDMRNKVNRVVNFELANVNRSAGAAAAQLLAIAKLRESPGLAALPDALREAALLRERNPEASLQELCELAGEPVTRSGMNHRLKRLEALARGAPGEK
ncbi:MAG: DNA-binding protein WhiA [Oscillospiraceae bacterium]|nr:DNA-binding protein WhiA [Oscillospiraceae bacterium]